MPRVVSQTSARAKSATLQDLGDEIFGNQKFDAFKAQVHGREATFSPGFGCTISDAVQAVLGEEGPPIGAAIPAFFGDRSLKVGRERGKPRLGG